eukprot:2273016-Pyramimonas_sp.AAC.1
MAQALPHALAREVLRAEVQQQALVDRGVPQPRLLQPHHQSREEVGPEQGPLAVVRLAPLSQPSYTVPVSECGVHLSWCPPCIWDKTRKPRSYA